MITRKTQFKLLYSSKENFYIIQSYSINLHYNPFPIDLPFYRSNNHTYFSDGISTKEKVIEGIQVNFYSSF